MIRRRILAGWLLLATALPCAAEPLPENDRGTEFGREADAEWKTPGRRPKETTPQQPTSTGTFDTSFLPEVLLKYDGRPLHREQGLAILSRTGYQPGPETSRAEFCDRLRKAIDEELCRAVIRTRLKEKGITPSYQAALAFLRRSAKQIPTELSHLAVKPEKYGQIASDGDYQLMEALIRYFEKVEPDKLKVSDAEVEFVYRTTQKSFLAGSKYDISFIGVSGNDDAARRKLAAASARLLQGESFNRVAEEYNRALPDSFYSGGRLPSALIQSASLMEPNSTPKTVELPGALALVRLQGSGGKHYIPLADAAYFIRMTVSSRLAARELRRMIEETMNKRKLEVFF